MSYKDKVEETKKYITVNGMFQVKKEDHSYELRDENLNKD